MIKQTCILAALAVVFGVASGTDLRANTTGECPGVIELQEERTAYLSDLIASLTEDLNGAPEADRKRIETQIRFLETRLHLMDVAYHRLSGPNLNDRNCAAIEAFILRHSSVS